MDNELRYQIIVTENGNLVIQGSQIMLSELKKRAGQRGFITYSFEEKSVKGLAYHFEKELIPQFKKASINLGEYLNESVIKKRLWYMSSVTRDLDHETPYKLGYQEALLFIADLCRIAAENYNFYLVTYQDK